MTRTLRIIALVAIFLIIIAPFAALAAGSYSATYTVTNNSTTASYSMLPVIGAANNAYMAANDFFNSTANDTRVQTLGGLEKPWTVADNKTLTAIPVVASSQTNLYFTTENTPASSMDIVLGYGGNITTADNATLDWGTSGNISGRVYADTSAAMVGQNVVSRAGSAYIRVTAAQQLTAYLYGVTGLSTTVGTNAQGAVTDIPVCFGYPPDTPALHWLAQLNDDGDGSYVENDAAGTTSADLYVMTIAAIPTSAVIDNVEVHAIGKTSGVGGGYMVVYLPAANVTGAYQGFTGAYADYSENLTRPGGGAWTVGDLTSGIFQAGVQLLDTVGTARSTQVYAKIYYHIPDAAAVLNAIPPGLYTVSASLVLSGGISTWTLRVGSISNTVTDATGSLSLVDSGNPWVWMGPAVPYAEWLKMSAAGTDVIWYQPNTIINGTVMPDRQGAAENGVISWGSNPAGVQVAIGSMTSSGQPSVGTVPTSTIVDILPTDSPSDQPVQDPEGLTDILKNSPLRPLIRLPVDITVGFGSPITEWQSWQFAALTAVLSVAICSALAVRNHLLISGFATAAAIIGVVAYTIWPWWSLLFAAVAILGGAIAERSPWL